MSITNRTVYYDVTDGIKRFWDWASVTTTIGSMVEPFVVNARVSKETPIIEFDPTDEIARIDEIKGRTIDKSLLVLSGGDYQLHGGYMMPRDGR